MKILRQQEIIEDPWRSLAPEEQQPPFPAGDLLVEAACWRTHSDALAARPDGRTGLVLGVEEAWEELVPELPRLALICLEFPKFYDGRPLSTARLLRERHGYRGELRATGDVRRDQLAFMRRCGFDSFQMAPGQDLQQALEALHGLSVCYQPAADRAPTASQLRTAGAPRD